MGLGVDERLALGIVCGGDLTVVEGLHFGRVCIDFGFVSRENDFNLGHALGLVAGGGSDCGFKF
ncbi:hypothetical protein D3C85_1473580 [compost metagenome]